MTTNRLDLFQFDSLHEYSWLNLDLLLRVQLPNLVFSFQMIIVAGRNLENYLGLFRFSQLEDRFK